MNFRCWCCSATEKNSSISTGVGIICCNESRTRFRLVGSVLGTGRVVDPGVQHFPPESIIKLHGVDSLVLLQKIERANANVIST